MDEKFFIPPADDAARKQWVEKEANKIKIRLGAIIKARRDRLITEEEMKKLSGKVARNEEISGKHAAILGNIMAETGSMDSD